MGGLIQPQPVAQRRTQLRSFLGGNNLFTPPVSGPPAPGKTTVPRPKPIGADTPPPNRPAAPTSTAPQSLVVRQPGGRPDLYRLPSGALFNEPPGSAAYAAAAAAEHQGLSAGTLLSQRGYAGMGPPPQGFEFLGHFLARAGGNLAEDALNWPGGVKVLGTAGVHDVGRATHGDVSFRETRPLVAGMGRATIDSFLHPNARPGDTLLNAFAAASLGAGAAARAGAAGSAIRAGEGVGAALTRPGHAGGSLLHRPEPGTQRIYVPGGRPEPVKGPLELAREHAAALEQQLAENEHRHQAVGLPVRDDISDLERSRQAMHDVGQRTPPPELNMAIRLGRERARIAEGLNAAQQAVQHHEGLQAGLDRTETAQGPRPAISVDRLLPRNALARQGSKLRNHMIQKALMDETPASARTAVGKALRNVFGPESTVGREIRAEGRVQAARANAPVMQLSHAIEGIIGHGMSRGEHTALGVAGIEGHHAFGGDSPVHGVETPAQVVARHIATHERYIEEGKSPETNAQHIADLRMAQQHLENPSPKFLRAVEFARRASNGTAQQLVREDMLTPEAEAGRRAAIAAMYRGDRFNPSTPAREGVSEPLERAGARVDRLQKAWDRLEAKGQRGGYVVTERPRTVTEARTRLKELEHKVGGFRAGVQAKMFNEKLTPEELADQRQRNTKAGIADRQAAGLTKTGVQAKRNEEALRLEKGKLADLTARHGQSKSNGEYLRYSLEHAGDDLPAAERAKLTRQAEASEAAAAKLADQIKASRTKIADLETRKLSFKGKRLKSGANARKAVAPKSTVKEDRAVQVDAEIDRILEQHKGEEWAQAARQQLDELDALHYALQPQASFMEAAAPAAADLGVTRASEFKRTSGTMERRGGALSVAKDELEQAAKRAANAVEPTGFHDAAHTPEGSFYFPLSRRFTDKAPRLGGNHARTQPGEFGMSPVNEGGVVSKQQFTGESVTEARGLHQVGRTIAQRAVAVNRLLATKRLYEEMWTAASPVRRSENDIPIRYGKEIRADLRDFFAKLADQLHATPDEEMALNATELARLKALLQPDDLGNVDVGSTIAGVRWVDQRFLKSTGEVNVRDGLQKLADTINNPIRAVQLYGRPAYILNLFGNIGMQLTTEGARIGPSMRMAVRSSKSLGHDDTAVVDSYMGTSRARIHDVNTGVFHDVNHRLAEAWNLLTDLYSRRSAFYTEAARAGFKTPAQIRELLHDPVHERKLSEVVRRANKNIVDYDSLTPVEKTYLRRIIYFEPWITRGTLWALRAVVEHPAKSYAINQLGAIGAEKAHLEFGDLPKWARELGLIPVGKEHDGLLGTLNPSSINTPATVVQVGEAIAHPLDKDVGLRNLVTPATGGATALLGSSSEAPPKGIFKHLPIVGNMLESLPPVQAIRRTGRYPGFAGPPSKTYPDTGIGAALKPFTFGGAATRNVSLPALHAQAEKQKPADVRAADHVRNEQRTMLEEARRVHLIEDNAGLPPDVVKAYAIQTQRHVAYAKLGSSGDPATLQQQRFAADLELGQKVGSITAEEAREWAAQAKAHPADIAKARRWINDHRFGGKLLTEARTAVRHHGGDMHPRQR